MSGGIDPLLPDGDASDARASAALDVTAVYDRHRVRLTRIARAITLDTVLADEIVHESLLELQKKIGGVADPLTELEQTVVRLCTSRRVGRGDGLTTRGRRKVAARKPAPVKPHLEAASWLAMWAAFTRLDPRRRALLVLVDWQGETIETAGGHVGLRRHRAGVELRDARQRLADAASGVDPPTTAEMLLAVVMPQFADGEDAAPGELGDPTPTGPTALRLFAPAEPRRRRLAWALGSVALVLTVVVVVTVYSRGQGDLVPTTSPDGDGSDTDADRDAPEWYAAMRPLVPERFDRMALVRMDDDAVGYLAVDTQRGPALDIEISRPGVAVVGEPPDRVTVVETDEGARAVRPDGVTIEVSCDECAAESPADPSATRQLTGQLAVDVAESFSFDDVGPSFGAPSPLRTDPAGVDAAVDGVTGAQVEQASGDVVQTFSAPAAGIDVLIVHGVYPVPAEPLHEELHAAGTTMVGWVVDADGTASRVVASAGGDVGDLDAEARGDLAERIDGLLDALVALPASA